MILEIDRLVINPLIMKGVPYNPEIERFLQGGLEEAESNEFRKRLQGDPKLQNEVQLHDHLLEGIKLAAEDNLKRKLLAANAQISGYSPKDLRIRTRRRLRIWVASSAAVLTLVFLAYQALPFLSSPEFQIQEMVGQHRPISLTNLGNGGSQLKLAEISYNKKQYGQAVQYFDQYLSTRPKDFEVSLYKAISLRHIGQYSDAIISFQDLINSDSEHLFGDAAKYELALTYIALKDEENAIVLLKDLATSSDSDWREEATKLLGLIEKKTLSQ